MEVVGRCFVVVLLIVLQCFWPVFTACAVVGGCLHMSAIWVHNSAI